MSLQFFHLTHHKCGTRWINSICSEVCLSLGKTWKSASNKDLFNGNMDQFARKNGVHFLSYTNAAYEYVSTDPKLLGFHVIRDPRDILVSSYFSSLKTHSDSNWSELTEHRKQLQGASEEEGLLLEMDFISDVFESLSKWNYEDTRILEMKMEDLMLNNYREVFRIFSHLDLLKEEDQSTSSLKVQAVGLLRSAVNRLYFRSRGLSGVHFYPDVIPVLNLLAIVHRNRFEGKAGGRKPGDENRESHYRKGISGDWKNHFTFRIRDRFKEQYGDLLVNLGYAVSNDW